MSPPPTLSTIFVARCMNGHDLGRFDTLDAAKLCFGKRVRIRETRPGRLFVETFSPWGWQNAGVILKVLA